MFIKRLVPVALCGLLLASPLVPAEEAVVQAPQGGTGSSGEATATGQAPETKAPTEGMTKDQGMMGAQGMAPEQGNTGKSGDMAMQPGMGVPGKPWCHRGKVGMKGMMQGGGMGKGGMMGGCVGHGGMTQEQFRELNGRLAVLDARMAKIEVMLERLLEQ
jgi:hypothetical protein